ncbi:hypothetical protein CAPTEDRAFT_163231 [Capitella teleta]|uniref:CHCH domain-containing protein n=1 Tax=Capitella teleta TaxID=283909 RepID=R7TV99_CAPTE|nr:hypothetical protein CAPTEDRAFT_163231 [Capitella teleta]|eukprot:ELT97517.1 hypothetical protein CAPTEDRAFT_163231 [Capitella teleta]
MSSYTFNQKTIKVKPPEKGSFPLDHEGECKIPMIKYMKCLRDNKMSNTICRPDAKEYFQCRMQHGLMKAEDWNKLGFADLDAKEFKEKT